MRSKNLGLNVDGERCSFIPSSASGELDENGGSILL